MQRYFPERGSWGGNTVHIVGEDVHHIKNVLRMKPGDVIICNHPDGYSARCEMTEVAEGSVRANILELLEEEQELPVYVTIAQALLKGDNLELALQKGTELGADAFIPFEAARTIVTWDERKKAKKQMRFDKIVKEASEQSQRAKIPSVHPIHSHTELLEARRYHDIVLFAYEEEARSEEHQSLGDILKPVEPGNSILICIGPEGGFTPEEVSSFKQSGFVSCRFGPRILRAETAGLYALASISYHYEELRWESCRQ